MLQALCNAFGVSGAEDNVRDLIISYAKPHCDEMKTDRLGNLLCFRKGKESGKTLMLCAHMDEVGLIARHIFEDGSVSFQPVGGIDPRVLVAKKVIFENGTVGVIGIKPPHLQKKGEADNAALTAKELRVDIGCFSAEETTGKISEGDYMTFDSAYRELGDSVIKAKALDDRVGCYLLLKAMEQQPRFDTWYVFTVQEETGCRGAVAAAKNAQPDHALILEGTTCSDVPNCKEYGYSTVFGNGPALSVMDGGSVSDSSFTSEIADAAKAADILFQYKKTMSGGNDARSVQMQCGGVKTAVLSLPCRYLHSPVSMIHRSDLENAWKLIELIVMEGLPCLY